MNIRQNGRRRGRNNNGGGGNRPQGGNRGGHDSGNRIDSRARGNASQMIEKYKNLARDAQLSGDRVQTEYYLQFADHYFRVLSDFRMRQDEGRPQGQERWQGRNEGVENFDGRDDMDAPEHDGGMPDDGYAQDDDADARGGNGNGNGDGERRDHRDQRPRGGNNGQRPREDRGPREDRAQREDRSPREDRAQRDDRGPREPRPEREPRGDRQERAPRPERIETAVVASEDSGAVRGRGRRGRPAADEDQGGDVIDTAVLPPAIARAPAADSDGEADAEPAAKIRRPRRTLAAPKTTTEAAE